MNKHTTTTGVGKTRTIVGEPTIEEKLEAAEARIAELERAMNKSSEKYRPSMEWALMVDRLDTRIAELERVLREVEWSGAVGLSNERATATCPWCGALRQSGHLSDCPRQAVLK